jgi:hypothetical protein
MKIVMALILFCRMQATAQDMQSCPMHKQHQAEVEKHGDEAMGFSHEKTTHHFHLLPDGGTIEVTITGVQTGNESRAEREALEKSRAPEFGQTLGIVAENSIKNEAASRPQINAAALPN